MQIPTYELYLFWMQSGRSCTSIHCIKEHHDCSNVCLPRTMRSVYTKCTITYDLCQAMELNWSRPLIRKNCQKFQSIMMPFQTLSINCCFSIKIDSFKLWVPCSYFCKSIVCLCLLCLWLLLWLSVYFSSLY